jgi:hypothetical protein
MNVVRTIRTAGVMALIGLFVLAGQPLEAQTTTASVSGAVADSQGGFLPGATVTLTSNTQGNTLTAVSDAQGNFQFNVVRPDTYTLRVTMTGFKTLERPRLVVNANDKFFAGTMTLDVGEMTESVTVLARVTELQASSGERSFTLENEQMENLAVNGRSMFGLLGLVPGVVNMGGGAVNEVSGVSVNGQRSQSNNLTIDGVANIDTGNNGGNMVTTNIDALAEFKVLTNSYQAEYGRATGAQVQVVTKSGSQDFHGSAYWYGRRGNWNANTWTNNRDGAARNDEASRNDYGGTLGGPIFFPGFNEEKKKLFFFASVEWQKRSDPVGERIARVPTALERQGDFSQSLDNSGNPWPYIRDYTTGLPCGPTDTSGCFADGGVLGRIPANSIYQPGLNALNIYPAANFAGDNGRNFRSQAAGSAPRREEMLRLDFQPNDNWRITGRYMRNQDLAVQPYGTTWAGAGSNNLPDIDVTFDHPGRNWMVSATGILDSTTSLEMSFGQAYNELIFDVQNQNLRRSSAGLDGLPLLFPSAVQQDYIPEIRFGGRGSNDAGIYETGNGPFINANRTYDAIINLTKVMGSHTAKVGFYFQSSWKPQAPFVNYNSEINFGENSSNPFDSGFTYANAALGVFNSYNQASNYYYPEWVYKNFEWYVQDNWKVDRKLTLDYGVRFYYMTPQFDQTLTASAFLPDQYDFNQAVRLYTPVCVGASPCSGDSRRGIDPALAGTTPTAGNTVDGGFIGQIVPGSGERFNGAFQAGSGPVGDQLASGSVFRVSPRFGFVYDISGRGSTILRGGFGIFYDRPMGNMVFDNIGNAPGMTQSTINFGLLQNLDQLFQTSTIVPPVSLRPTQFDFVPPKVYQWNLGVQTKLFPSITADVAYVGSSSHSLISSNQINAVPFGARYLPENQDPTRAPSSLPGQNALTDDLLRPFPGYGNINLYEFRSYSNYHALQMGLNRRFDNGFMVNAFYVWSKALGTANDDYSNTLPNATDAQLREYDYSYTSNDRPHNFVVSFIWQTPKVTDGGLGFLVNDWQLSGGYRWTSGAPYQVNFSIPGVGAGNLTGGSTNARVVVNGDPGSGNSTDPYLQIENPNVFAPPQPGSAGNESSRFFLHAPAINNLDLSLSKRFRVGDQIALEVRLDAFNALNHAQWSGVNNTVEFAGLDDPTITNLPYDANGNLVRPRGFGTINGVRDPRTIQLVTRLTF